MVKLVVVGGFVSHLFIFPGWLFDYHQPDSGYCVFCVNDNTIPKNYCKIMIKLTSYDNLHTGWITVFVLVIDHDKSAIVDNAQQWLRSM